MRSFALRLALLAALVLSCTQPAHSAVLIGRGSAPRAVNSRRISAFSMMAGAQRWPEIVRGYVSAKFKTVDIDSSGEVDKSELAVMFRSLMPDADEAAIEAALADFFLNFDADGSGDIDEEEFFLAVMSNRLLNSDMRLKEQVYIDVLKSFGASGAQLLTPSAFSALEAQLDWEGSNVPLEYGKLAKSFIEA